MLIVDDPEVERLIERLSHCEGSIRLRGLNKNEALGEALRNELKRYENASGLIETGVAFVRALCTHACNATSTNSTARASSRAFTTSVNATERFGDPRCLGAC